MPPSATTEATVIDPMVYLTGFSTTSSALNVVDFVNLSPSTSQRSGCAADALEQYVSAKCSTSRVKLEDVTVNQWGLANTRIMHELYPSGGPDITRYMAYTCKVFELFENFDCVSVLRYDKRYREMQAASGFSWGADVPHLNTTMLIKRSAPTAHQPSTQPHETQNYENREGADQRSHTSATAAEVPAPSANSTQPGPAPAMCG